MVFDYSELLGKIKARGFIQETLAKHIGIAKSSMSLKLNNRAFFTQQEIKKICNALCIPDDMIGLYFFTIKVQEN